MAPLFLDNAAVEGLLDPVGLTDALEAAYRAFAGGGGVSAPRQDLQAAPAGALTYQLGVVAGISGRYAALRVKSDMTFLRQVGGALRKEKYAVEPGRYCGLVLLFSTENGAPLAMIQDGLLQRMRVAADSAIGVRLMARPEAATLGLLGSGGMAEAHWRAIAAARPIRRVIVHSPTPRNRERFAEMARAAGVEARAVATAAEAAREADILASCASAVEPTVRGRDLRPGTHLVAIGGGLDAEASARVDRWLRLGSATAAPEWGGHPVEAERLSFASGEAARSGGSARFHAIPAGRRVTLGELTADPSRGRASDDEITFSDRGNIHGLQFAAAAGWLFERAAAAGAGRATPLDDFIQTVRN